MEEIMQHTGGLALCTIMHIGLLAFMAILFSVVFITKVVKNKELNKKEKEDYIWLFIGSFFLTGLIGGLIGYLFEMWNFLH